MSKIVVILGAFLLAAALIVPVALARDGGGLPDESLRERVERIRIDADELSSGSMCGLIGATGLSMGFRLRCSVGSRLRWDALDP
ncbi:MAG: hypothetical protein QF609_04570 [Gammaproteobacteria bacterium]|nr:hypothetical protein [Gammaproteobacteria bacterium]